MTRNKKPAILFYDIETSPLQAYMWQLGKQVVRHNQLVHGHSRWGIICITYCWNDGKPAKILRMDKHGGTKGQIELFDELVKQADITIGKNSDRFDTKMINSARMFAGLKGLPEWTKYTDDLERQMRRYFRLPSMSLDYISDELGLGGKVKMCFQDWIDISDLHKLRQFDLPSTSELNHVSEVLFGEKASAVKKRGMAALEKMCYYGGKDVEDTRTLWYHLEEHFDHKFNAGVLSSTPGPNCKRCGSANTKPNGTRMAGKIRYQQYRCGDCHQYAGRAPITSKTPKSLS